MLDFRRKRIGAMHQAMIELAGRAADGEELDPVDEEAEGEAERFGAVVPVEELEPWPDEPPSARVARIGAALTRHTETIVRRVEAGLPLESRQVAALSNLVSLCERIAVMANEEAERQEISDEELALTLQAIDLKMIYIAGCEARELCVRVFGIPRREVDAKLPEPEDRSLPVLVRLRKMQKERGAR